MSDSNTVTPRFTLDGGDSVLGLDAWRQATGQDVNSFASTPAALPSRRYSAGPRTSVIG